MPRFSASFAGDSSAPRLDTRRYIMPVNKKLQLPAKPIPILLASHAAKRLESLYLWGAGCGLWGLHEEMPVPLPGKRFMNASHPTFHRICLPKQHLHTGPDNLNGCFWNADRIP
jgi:hypothetical protein